MKTNRRLLSSVGLLAGLVPFGLIALARSQPSTQPPVHPIQDMFRQQKFRPQRGNPMFADGRAMRPRLPGVTASTDLQVDNEMVNDAADPHMIDDRDAPLELNDELTYQRVVEGTEPQADGKPAYVKPIPVRDLFQTPNRSPVTARQWICSSGAASATRSTARFATARAATATARWPSARPRSRRPTATPRAGSPPRTITATTCGSSRSASSTTRSPTASARMPAYAKQISVLDRWAIVAYVKALQRSQDAKPEDIPEAEKDKYK